MELSIQELDQGITLIQIAGGLDGASLKTLHDNIENTLDADRHQIIVDCSKLTFVSSAGIGALVTLHRRVTEAKGQVQISGATGVVFEVLEIMNLGSILNLSPDVQHAQEALHTTQNGTPG